QHEGELERQPGTEERVPVVDSARQEPHPPDIASATTPVSEPPPPAPKKVGQSLGLDASDYLPISRDEIKASAQGQNLLSNPWVGRRALIPPADDPRTQLIDRAMITQGLITPEQLAEIHTVGAEMDRVRPTMTLIEHQAAMTGEAAVQVDR